MVEQILLLLNITFFFINNTYYSWLFALSFSLPNYIKKKSLWILDLKDPKPYKEQFQENYHFSSKIYYKLL